MECLQLSDHMMHYRYFYYYFCFTKNFNCFEVVLLVFKAEFAKERKTTEYGRKHCSVRLNCLLISGYWFELEILYCDFTSV